MAHHSIQLLTNELYHYIKQLRNNYVHNITSQQVIHICVCRMISIHSYATLNTNFNALEALMAAARHMM